MHSACVNMVANTDEAHNIEDSARESGGISLSMDSIDLALADLHGKEYLSINIRL